MALWVSTEGQMVNPVLILLFYKSGAEINRPVHEAEVLRGARGLLSGNTTWYTFSWPSSSNVMHAVGVLYPVQSSCCSSKMKAVNWGTGGLGLIPTTADLSAYPFQS